MLKAAKAELVENGLEGFSLRKVARRAGVSHAAPAHHFRDAGALLTALAAQGFRDFVALKKAREALAADAPGAQLVAQALGYVAFARDETAIFRLMFASERLDFTDPELNEAASLAYGRLMAAVARVTGEHRDTARQANAFWALAHGMADLNASGRMALPQNADQEAELTAIFTAALPTGPRA
ncbi:MAG: WHG domain-containing protein [Pseudomonadota bacterium]